jgi:hypothetical protein
MVRTRQLMEGSSQRYQRTRATLYFLGLHSNSSAAGRSGRMGRTRQLMKGSRGAGFGLDLVEADSDLLALHGDPEFKRGNGLLSIGGRNNQVGC